MFEGDTKSFDSILAVFAKTERGTEKHLGTAFAMGRGVFGTAAHVAEAVLDLKNPVLRRRREGGQVDVIPITAAEAATDIDFGMLHADISPTPMPWVSKPMPERIDVWAEGYGFGFDPERKKLVGRFLKGYVVSRQTYENWSEFDRNRTGTPDRPFAAYELSFMVPSGQSGAPLVWTSPSGLNAIIGVVTGNSMASMGTIDSSETIGDTEKVERFEHHNYLHLGAAISTESLLFQKSAIRGKTVIDHFEGRVSDLQ